MLLNAGFGAGRLTAGSSPITAQTAMRATQVVTKPASGPVSSYYCNAGVCYGTGDRVVMFTQLQSLLTAAMNAAYTQSQHAYQGPVITAPAGVIDQSVVNAIISLRDIGFGPTLTPIDVKITPDFVAQNADAIAATLAQWLGVPFQSGAPYTTPNTVNTGKTAPAQQTTPAQYQCWDGSTVADPVQCPPAPASGDGSQTPPATQLQPPPGTPGGQQVTPQFFTCPDGSLVNSPDACQPTTALATVQGWFTNPIVKWGAIALGLLTGGLILAKIVKRRPATGMQGFGFDGLEDFEASNESDELEG